MLSFSLNSPPSQRIDPQNARVTTLILFYSEYNQFSLSNSVAVQEIFLPPLKLFLISKSAAQRLKFQPQASSSLFCNRMIRKVHVELLYSKVSFEIIEIRAIRENTILRRV